MTSSVGLSLIAGRLAFARGLARVPVAILPLVIVAQYGASASTDCFFLVYAAVMFATNSFAPLLETVVVPFVAEARHDGREAAFVKTVMLRVAALFTPLSAALAALAVGWQVIGWPVPPGWDAGWQHLLVLAWIPVLNALASVLAGYLNAGEWFLSAAIAGSVRGVIGLGVGMAFSPALGLFAYALGLALGELGALIWFVSTPPGSSALAARPVDRRELSRFWRLFMSSVSGGLANSSKAFVDRFVAASLGAGAVSIMESAERIFLMAASFLGAPFSTVILSRWSAAYAGGTAGAERRLVGDVRHAQRLAVLLGAAILLVYPVVTFAPIWSRLFGRFDPSEAPVVRMALLFYLLGAVPYLLGLITTPAILVLRDNAFIVTVAVVIALANVPLDLIGASIMGIPGIALGSSLLHLVGWLAAELRLRTHVRRTPWAGALR